MARISASLRIGSSSGAVDSDSSKKMSGAGSFTNTSSAEILRLTGNAAFNKNYTTVKVAVEDGGPVVITKIEMDSTAGSFTIYNGSGTTVSSEYHFKGNNPRSTSGTITAVKIYGYVGSGGGGGSEPDVPDEPTDTPGLIFLTGNLTFNPSVDVIESGTGVEISYYVGSGASNVTSFWLERTSSSGAVSKVDSNSNSSSSASGYLYDTPVNETEQMYTYTVGYTDAWGYEYRFDLTKTYTVRAAQPKPLGAISTPTFSGTNVKTISGTTFVLSQSNYTINWTGPSTSNTNNSVSQLILYSNGQATNLNPGTTSYPMKNTFGKADKVIHSITAIAAKGGSGNNSQSAQSTIYNLSVSPQTSITSNNTELITGSAKLSWSAPSLSVDESLRSSFTYDYTIKYQTSTDKEKWETAITLGTSTTTSYTISDVSTLNLKGKFVKFIISTNVKYKNTTITTVTTGDSDNFIKYAGGKPNQLSYIKFDSTDLKNNTYSSRYVYSGTSYNWEAGGNFKYIKEGATVTVGFNSLVTGYTLPGVRVTWKKGSIEKTKDFPAASASTTSLKIAFTKDDFFTSDFWSESGTLTLTFTSYATLSTGTKVLEEARGYLYKGSDIQTAKKPTMSNTGTVSPSNKTIPVNFTSGNQEPIVDPTNNIYEDVKIVGIKGSHEQEIEIYGYKVYCTINNTWDSNWKTTKLVSDALLSASEGGSYSNKMFIPNWEKDVGDRYEPITNNIITLGLNILNSSKNSHLTTILGSAISSYGEKLDVTYRVTAIDVFNQESDNYYSYNFYYDCRKPATFHTNVVISSPSSVSAKPIEVYSSTITAIPVFNGDAMMIKFYPAVNTRDVSNNSSKYVVSNGKTYLKFASDNSIVDPNYYHVYKFVRQASGELKSYWVERIQPFLVNSPIIKKSETISGQQILYYLYKLNFNLNNEELDEIQYFQIVPYYQEENEIERISRINYYTNNSNGFNICSGSSSATFWTSRINSPKIQVSGIERIATSVDNFGFELPKLKIGVTDWGTTHQFHDGPVLNSSQLAKYNRLTSLTYSIKYYREKVQTDGTTEKEALSTTWSRNYITNSAQSIDYNTLATEYKDYYTSFDVMKDAMKGDYKTEYSSVTGTTKLPIPTTGTTLYINLPSPIKGTAEGTSNFFADLTVTGYVNRVNKNADDTASFKSTKIELANYSIYISQNKKTFIIQQGKIGINQPALSEVEESLYIIDKKSMSGTGTTHPNIVGVEADRNFNKINGMTGAFIGFYDDSSKHGGKRVLMGSIGLGMTLNNETATGYVPYVYYDANANGTLTALKLIPEAGSGIKVNRNVISHKNAVTALTTASFVKMKYDSEGHITGHSTVTSSDIRSVGRIAYGTTEPGASGFSYPLGTVKTGDIYLWLQS